jgi:hypothetical protein
MSLVLSHRFRSSVGPRFSAPLQGPVSHLETSSMTLSNSEDVWTQVGPMRPDHIKETRVGESQNIRETRSDTDSDVQLSCLFVNTYGLSQSLISLSDQVIRSSSFDRMSRLRPSGNGSISKEFQTQGQVPRSENIPTADAHVRSDLQISSVFVSSRLPKSLMKRSRRAFRSTRWVPISELKASMALSNSEDVETRGQLTQAHNVKDIPLPKSQNIRETRKHPLSYIQPSLILMTCSAFSTSATAVSVHVHHSDCFGQSPKFTGSRDCWFSSDLPSQNRLTKSGVACQTQDPPFSHNLARSPLFSCSLRMSKTLFPFFTRVDQTQSLCVSHHDIPTGLN